MDLLNLLNSVYIYSRAKYAIKRSGAIMKATFEDMHIIILIFAKKTTSYSSYVARATSALLLCKLQCESY